MRSGFSLRPENKKEIAEQQCGSLRRAALVTTPVTVAQAHNFPLETRFPITFKAV